MNSLKIHFCFHGDDLDPEEVTTFLGIRPDDTRRKRSIHDTSSWSLSSDKIADVTSFDDYIAAFIATLYPHVEKLRVVADRPGIKTALAFWWNFDTNDGESRPAFNLGMDAVAFLAAVKASIDIDGYPSA